MQKAQIKDGVVVNVCLVDPDNIPAFLESAPDVPEDVGPGWTYDGKDFAPPVRVIGVAQVKSEAERRILLISPLYRQLNDIRRAAEISSKAKSKRTNSEAEEFTEIQRINAQIDHIRTRSNEIEAMDPIPVDFTDDQHWQNE